MLFRFIKLDTRKVNMSNQPSVPETSSLEQTHKIDFASLAYLADMGGPQAVDHALWTMEQEIEATEIDAHGLNKKEFSPAEIAEVYRIAHQSMAEYKKSLLKGLEEHGLSKKETRQIQREIQEYELIARSYQEKKVALENPATSTPTPSAPGQ